MKFQKLHKLDIDDNIDTKNVELPQEYLDKLKTMFKTLIDFLDEHNIEYFIEGGTLLGCVRDKGQIKWDDDVDLGMLPSHYNNFRKVLQKFSQKGYRVIDYPQNVIKISDLNNAYFRTTVDEELTPRTACIDIFQYVLQKQYYVLENKQAREYFKGATFHKSELYPLKEYDYEDFKVKGANIPEGYLSRCYGDWKKRCIHIYT